MSLTPLHIGAGYGLRKHMSYRAFIAANVLMDLPVVAAVMDEVLGDVSPPGSGIHDLHTVGYAVAVALVIWLVMRTHAAIIGAAVGVASHLFIDAIYHADVMPVWGLYGLMQQEHLDLLLLGLFVLPIGWEAFKRCRTKLAN
jgi:hypothetical protein